MEANTLQKIAIRRDYSPSEAGSRCGGVSSPGRFERESIDRADLDTCGEVEALHVFLDHALAAESR